MGQSLDPGFWSRILAEKDLESPGREEAVKATLAHLMTKKQKAEEGYKEKQASKRKKNK